MRRLPILVFFSNLLLFTLLRVVFLAVFRSTAGPLDPHDLVHAFYLGMKFDARLAAIITLPLLFIRRFAVPYIVICEALIFALYAADFGTYAYVHQRLNAGVLE